MKKILNLVLSVAVLLMMSGCTDCKKVTITADSNKTVTAVFQPFQPFGIV